MRSPTLAQKMTFLNRFIQWADRQRVESLGDGSTIRTLYAYNTLETWQKDLIDEWIGGKLSREEQL